MQPGTDIPLESSQRQLFQAAKLASIGELAGGVAHEVNNPISIILMRSAHLAQAMEECALSAEAREDLEVIRRQAEKIGRIVSALRVFAHQPAMEVKQLSLNKVVERTAALLSDLGRSRGVELVVDLTPGLPPIEGDGARIEQILLNLANNAFDAMPGGGTLRFGTAGPLDRTPRERRVALVVEDSGVGIPAEHLARIFDPFFTTKEVGQGTGLGLSATYGIVEEHGGKIAVDSEPGRGTRFTIYLPLPREEIPHRDESEIVHGR